jgi:hypothetical protein
MGFTTTTMSVPGKTASEQANQLKLNPLGKSDQMGGLRGVGTRDLDHPRPRSLSGYILM